SSTGTYTVFWTTIANAAGYILQESDDDSFEILTGYPVTGTALLFTGKANGTYFYRIKAVNGTIESVWSPDVKSITVSLEMPTGPTEISFDGTAITLYVGIPQPVTINGEAHTITVLSVTGTSAVVEIRSNPQQVSLNVGETANVDTDGNGLNDLAVTLVSITDGAVSLSFQLLDETLAEEGGMDMLLILGIVAVVVVVLLVFIFMKKKGGDNPGETTEETVVEATQPEESSAEDAVEEVVDDSIMETPQEPKVPEQ
ncbi:MAG: hypothetical protein QCI38_00230, partial [Candidatus Thermoplasmatota archaeon]|nr:hypothetical protein [Candidatus Thermoplasmatota archaeon]